MASGLFDEMEWAMCCSITVLPDFGEATSSPRCPLPIGRDDVDDAPGDVFLGAYVALKYQGLGGNNGVRFSNRILFLAFSGGSPLTLSTLTNAT